MSVFVRAEFAIKTRSQVTRLETNCDFRVAIFLFYTYPTQKQVFSKKNFAVINKKDPFEFKNMSVPTITSPRYREN